MIERGWKKGGKCIFFPQLVKIMHIFPHLTFILLYIWFWHLQNCKKKYGWTFFVCGAHPLIIINLIWGQISRRGRSFELNLIYTLACRAGEPANFLAAPAPGISFRAAPAQAPRGQKTGSGSWLLVKFGKIFFSPQTSKKNCKKYKTSKIFFFYHKNLLFYLKKSN